MERTSLADFACSIARALDVVGEWWTLLVLRDLMLGIDRFDELQRDLGVASNVLAARLKKLVEAGLVERHPVPDDGRAVRYVLSASGRDLYPVLLALMAWGDKWLGGRAGQPLQVVHRGCGKVTAAVPHCSVCGEPLALRDIEFHPGPGGRLAPGTAVVAERLAAGALRAADAADRGLACREVPDPASPAPNVHPRGDRSAGP